MSSQARWQSRLGLSFLAGAVVLLQLALLRIFSFAIWHHFAFMVVGVALLGFSLAGVLEHVSAGSGDARRLASRRCVAFALTALVTTWLCARVPFDPTQIAENPAHAAWLGVFYVLLLVPFTFAGWATVGLLHGLSRDLRSLYAADLVGAGVAAMLSIPLFSWLGAEGCVSFGAGLALLSALLLGHRHEQAGRTRLVAALALSAFAFAPVATALVAGPPGPSKALHAFLDQERFPEARLASSHWNAISRVDVVEGSGPIRWLQNADRPVPPPPQVHLVIDGDAATPIVDTRAGRTQFLDTMLPSLAAQALRPKTALVIGAGGGVDVLSALHHGAEHVDAVELNPIIAELVTGPYAEWSGGLFQRPEVRLYEDEGRAFLRRSSERYDLIQLSLIDTWAASASGAYSLAEGYLYTREAFESYLDHLSDTGVLTLSRWRWAPPRELMKLTATAVAALEAKGAAHPEQHLLVVANGPFGSLLVKRTPFRESELRQLAAVTIERGFEVHYAPVGNIASPFRDFVHADSREKFFADYPYDVRPATDDRPFFFEFGRWRDANPFGRGWEERIFLLSGKLVLAAVLLQACLLTGVLLLVFRLRRGTEAPRLDRGRVVTGSLYFASLGLAFMFVEIALMQRLTLFLGHPLYATAFVLAVLLIATGAGSQLSDRLLAPKRSGAKVFAALAALLAAAGPALEGLLRANLDLPLAARLSLAAIVVVPIGLLLGVPFPAGLARLNAGAPRSATGLAWAANGVGSVLGPILAVMLAMTLGLSAVFVLAALLYLIAYANFRRFSPRAPAETQTVARR